VTACHQRPPGTGGGTAADLPVVALVGRPNVGKSTFLARASGRFAETGNAPGTTLFAERRRVGSRNRAGEAWLVDLPGTTSLADRPAGTEPFWRLLLAERPDAILVVADAGDLARHLPLILACRDLGLPIVVAANLADEAAARGVELDTGRLAQLLVAPVQLTVGRDGRGVARALDEAIRLARRRRDALAGASPRGTGRAAIHPAAIELRIEAEARSFATAGPPIGARSLGAAAIDEDGLGALVASGALSARGAATLRLADVLEGPRWEVARRWADQVERRRTDGESGTSTKVDRLARLSTAPWPGLPLFVVVALASLLVTMLVGGWLAAVLGSAWTAAVSPLLTVGVHTLVPQPAIASALLWGLDGGLIALVSVGIPYVLTFYLVLALLEDSGYLTSAAVLTDRLFNLVGLPGRAAIPLLAASGCNVPAIYGTRVLATRRERLIASLLVTMTPCSARSAVVVAALAPIAGPGVALAAFGVIALLTIGGGVLANRMIPGRQPALVLELAPLRRPLLPHVVAKAWSRFEGFVRSAAPVMLAGSIVLGILYETGLVWPVAVVIDPLVGGWLGLPAVAGLALVFAFLRKELALQLLVALAVVQYGAAAANLATFMTPAQLFVYVVVASVSVPCVATLATLAAEFGWRAALALSGTTLAIALGAGGILARLLGVV